MPEAETVEKLATQGALCCDWSSVEGVWRSKPEEGVKHCVTGESAYGDWYGADVGERENVSNKAKRKGVDGPPCVSRRRVEGEAGDEVAKEGRC